MSKSLTININGEERNLFFQTGFYRHTKYKNLDFHIHSYEEIHIFLGCTATLITPSATKTLHEGEVAIIPRNTLHAYKMSDDEGSLHMTFQIDLPESKLAVKSFPVDFLRSMLGEASKMSLEEDGQDHSRVALYLSFISGHFSETKTCSPMPVRDHAFIIREYIAYNYALPITLENMAAELCVSKKQAERLMIKHTGHTFLEFLTEERMRAAEQYLSLESGMPLTKIAPLVGYQSYSGFYKAYKKYKSSKSQKSLK